MEMFLRYKGEFLSRASVRWRVEIWQQAEEAFAHVGELTFPADSPLTIEWPQTPKEDVICSAVATLKIESPGDRTYEDLYTIAPGRIRLDVYRDGVLYWSGTLDPEFYEEPYERGAFYDVTLTFSDFGILDRIKYDLSGVRTVEAIVGHCLRSAGINYGRVVTADYISTFFPTDIKPILPELSVRSENFFDEEGEASTLLETLEGVLQPLGLRIVQRAGNIYVYDLNGLYYTMARRQIEWAGDSSTMSADKVANNVKITFSPYASDGTLTPDFEYPGKYSADKSNLTGDNPADPDYGEYYSYYPDYASEHRRGYKWDYNLVDFTIFLSDAPADALAYKHASARYFHIQPQLGGAGECSGVAWGFYTGGHGGLDTGWPTPKLNIRAIGPGGGDSAVMRTRKVYLPKLAEADRGRYYVRLSLEMMLDARYNPFTDSGNGGNEDANDKAIKLWTNWAFVPVGVTLYGEDGTALKHYVNRPIAESGAIGHLNYARGTWEDGAASCGDAWLEYYDKENQKGESAIHGWHTNRHCIGRPDHGSRKNPAYMLEYTDFCIFESFTKMPDGEYIPYPPEGGWLEVAVFTGVRCFDYGEEYDFSTTEMWTKKDLYRKVRWLLYKTPKIELVKNTLVYDAAELDDVEYSGYINKDAKEEIAIDTICGTSADLCPTARGIYTRTSTGEQVVEMRRNNITDHPERLLIGTLCSQYSDRKTKLSGEVTIDHRGLCTYREQNQGDKKFMILGEVQDCIADTSEGTFVELSPDIYEAIEEVD